MRELDSLGSGHSEDYVRRLKNSNGKSLRATHMGITKCFLYLEQVYIQSKSKSTKS